MGLPRKNMGVAVLRDNSYVIGGYYLDSTSTTKVYLRSVERYSASADFWFTVEAMNDFRADAGVAVMDNKIYVFGGQNSSGLLTSVEVYDSYLKTWTTVRFFFYFHILIY